MNEPVNLSCFRPSRSLKYFETAGRQRHCGSRPGLAEADQFDIILVDTSPGTHCNVIGALRGTTHVLAVTEPTPLGAHDLDLILSLLDMFEVSKSVVVNRADLPGRLDQIRKVAARSMTVRSRPVWDWTNSCWQAICKGLPVVKSHPDSLAAVTFMDVADNLTEKYLGKEKEAA